MDFGWTPNSVTTKTSFAVSSTPAETPGKKERLLIDDEPEEIFDLVFLAIDQVDRDSIRNHYKACFGSLVSFLWISVPANIENGNSIMVNYSDDGYTEKPTEAGLWDLSIRFEKVAL